VPALISLTVIGFPACTVASAYAASTESQAQNFLEQISRRAREVEPLAVNADE